MVKDSSRKVENKRACDSLRPQRCPAVADDGGLLATVRMEEQPVGPLRVRSEGQSRPGPPDIRGQRPHDGVIASEAFRVVVVVHDGDLDRHAVEVDHAVDHVGGLGCGHTWGRGREVRGANPGTETPRVFLILPSIRGQLANGDLKINPASSSSELVGCVSQALIYNHHHLTPPTSSPPHPAQSASVRLTLVDAIDVEMERSAGFAHQPDVVSLLKVEDSSLISVPHFSWNSSASLVVTAPGAAASPTPPLPAGLLFVFPLPPPAPPPPPLPAVVPDTPSLLTAPPPLLLPRSFLEEESEPEFPPAPPSPTPPPPAPPPPPPSSPPPSSSER
ncbi:hypothetical protein EYF80_021901 [Liparis tanakae]|uniref:Uncharacterized protein n=1 Tax=Liparis tanakae TaxID=230148 RepID=A0A4Z2HSW5_9TELE|nr:hypothetical protein EYF80_021901 [Liparis tanakae]